MPFLIDRSFVRRKFELSTGTHGQRAPGITLSRVATLKQHKWRGTWKTEIAKMENVRGKTSFGFLLLQLLRNFALIKPVIFYGMYFLYFNLNVNYFVIGDSYLKGFVYFYWKKITLLFILLFSMETADNDNYTNIIFINVRQNSILIQIHNHRITAYLKLKDEQCLSIFKK